MEVLELQAMLLVQQHIFGGQELETSTTNLKHLLSLLSLFGLIRYLAHGERGQLRHVTQKFWKIYVRLPIILFQNDPFLTLDPQIAEQPASGGSLGPICQLSLRTIRVLAFVGGDGRFVVCGARAAHAAVAVIPVCALLSVGACSGEQLQILLLLCLEGGRAGKVTQLSSIALVGREGRGLGGFEGGLSETLGSFVGDGWPGGGVGEFEGVEGGPGEGGDVGPDANGVELPLLWSFGERRGVLRHAELDDLIQLYNASKLNQEKQHEHSQLTQLLNQYRQAPLEI